MAFTCKDKAKRMVAPVVVTVEATGQRSMSVAEPFAVYRLPDGTLPCMCSDCNRTAQCFNEVAVLIPKMLH